MYHKVDLESPTVWWVDVDNFYRQMCEIKCRKIVYLDEYNPSDQNQVVITFDGIYQNIYKYALPILKDFGYPFELFFSSDYVGKNNKFDVPEPEAWFCSLSELQELVKAGGRLQWHTKSHLDLSKITDEKEIEKEIIVPEKFKKLDKKGFTWFAYPYGNFNEKNIEIIKKFFRGAVSCVQGNDKNKYILNRVTVENSTSFKKASIAVIIPSYNYGSFLIEAVESVLRQKRPVDEIVISDDCSSDNTQEIGEAYQRKYPNLIRFNKNNKNLGIVKHFNKAVSLIKSDYICFLGADNRFRSDYIEKTAEVLDSDDKIAIAYTDCALFGSRASLLYNTVPSSQKGGIVEDVYYIVTFPDFTSEVSERMKTTNVMHGSSMYKRKAFLEAGKYQEDAFEDHKLFYRMIEKGWGAKRVPFPILEYRQHSVDQINIRIQSVQELNFYKSNYQQFKLVEAELEKIKNSKLWKLLFIYKNPKEGIKKYGINILKKTLEKMKAILHI